jgi:polyphosphate kinase
MNPFEYLNRDVSWLSFNHRVLQEAKDESVPLYERIKFLAIYSSNLDEFFRVRVASLRSFKQLRKKDRKEWLDIKPKKQLKEIRKIVQQQQAEFGAIFRSQILPELRKHQIFLTDDLSYSEEQKTFVRQYFLEHIKPLLEPVVFFDESQEAPFLKNKALYFIVQLKNKGQLALVEVPTDKTDRFVRLPGADHQHYITFVDDILRYHLNEVTQEEVLNAYSIKVSRDAELYIEDEYSGDLITKIKDSLEERNIGLPTRFLYDSAMSQELTDRIRAILQLKKDDMIPGARYHNFNDFLPFPTPLIRIASGMSLCLPAPIPNWSRPLPSWSYFAQKTKCCIFRINNTNIFHSSSKKPLEIQRWNTSRSRSIGWLPNQMSFRPS